MNVHNGVLKISASIVQGAEARVLHRPRGAWRHGGS
jgi:hypothetical protein